jgi:hypothetical protein
MLKNVLLILRVQKDLWKKIVFYYIKKQRIHRVLGNIMYQLKRKKQIIFYQITNHSYLSHFCQNREIKLINQQISPQDPARTI